MGRNWKIGTVASAAAVIILLVVGLSVGTSTSNGNKALADTSVATTVDFGPQQNPSDCVGEYNVSKDANTGNRILSDGLPAGKTAQQKLDYVTAVGAHDPRVLQALWNVSPPGKKQPVTDISTLVDNGCYSQHGIDLFNQLKGVYQASIPADDVAPATGANTGATPGGNVFQEPVGTISGDRSGIRVDFPNGSKVWIMNRCGNPVLPGPIPGIPTKPHPGTPGTQPPGTQPPGSTTTTPKCTTCTTTTTKPPCTTCTTTTLTPKIPRPVPTAPGDPRPHGPTAPGGDPGPPDPTPPPVVPSVTPAPKPPTTTKSRPTAPPAPSTTAPKPSDPETNNPPVTGDPGGF